MSDRLDELILDYQAGALDEAGLAELDAALRTHPSAAARFASWSRQAVTLHEVCEAKAEQRIGRDRSSRRLFAPPPAPAGRPWWAYAAAATVAAAALVALFVTLSTVARRPEPLSEDGQLALSGWTLQDDGIVIHDGKERKAPAGAFVLGGDGVAAADRILHATAEDGSRIRLDPGTRAHLERDRITLDQGTLGADIAKRPADHPLRVATAVATATIVGTAFTTESAPELTRLRVDEGRVRLQRGGDTVEVGAGECCDARPSGALAVVPAIGRGQGWVYRALLASGPPIGMSGGTFVADAKGPGQGAMRAGLVPSKNGLKQQRLALRNGYIDGPGAFTYAPDSVLHCTFRMLRNGKPAPAFWELFISMQGVDDSFFRLYHRFAAPTKGDGWVTVELPLRELDALGTDSLRPREGAICRDWLVDSYHSDCQLDIAEFGVRDAATSSVAPGSGKVQLSESGSAHGRVQSTGLQGTVEMSGGQGK